MAQIDQPSILEKMLLREAAQDIIANGNWEAEEGKMVSIALPNGTPENNAIATAVRKELQYHVKNSNPTSREQIIPIKDDEGKKIGEEKMILITTRQPILKQAQKAIGSAQPQIS
jgi:hypothetical protein